MKKNFSLSLVSLALALWLAPFVQASPQAQVIAPPADSGFNFGYGVDTQGDLLVVGSWAVDAAYVFARVNDAWQQAARLATDDDVEFSRFGYVVAVDDGVIAVGATHDTVNGLDDAGAVYVFERRGGEWTQVARIAAPLPIATGQFGEELALDGNRLLVAAATFVDPAAYLYERDANGNWQHAHTFSSADGSGMVADEVALSGDVVAFGHRRNGAYIYEHDGNAWALSETLPIEENFTTVALEGNRLAVGTSESLQECCPQSEGKVHVLERANGAWTRTAELTSPEPWTYGHFGWRVHLQDGLLVVAENYESAKYFAYAQDDAGEWQLFFEDGFGSGREDGLVHHPAISADSLAVGVSASSASEARVEAWSTPELLAAAGMGAGDDEPVDEGGDDDAGGDDGGSDDPAGGDAGDDGDDAGDGDGDGDGDGGDGSGPDPGSGDDGAGSADGGDDSAGSDDGDSGSGATGGGTSNASGGGEAGMATETTSGGGAFGWLMMAALLLAGSVIRVRRSS